MNAAAIQEWLLARYGAEHFRPGLERVGGFLAPWLDEVRQLRPKIITVVGTNGKGETALALAAHARAANVPFVLWTSPHLLRVTERFRSQEGEIAEGELSALVEQVEEARHRAGVGLSYYEALWAAFVRWGLARQSPLWILEVGLGGRLDAVNLLDADVVALPSISRDHQEFLGKTYRSILREKLGVVRDKTTLVSCLESAYLRSLVHEDLMGRSVRWSDLFEAGEVSLKSAFPDRNRRLAARVWQDAGFPAQSPVEGVFPGRGERWKWGPHTFTFYGSHNPDGMRKLVQFLRRDSYTFSEEKYHQVWVAFSQRPVGDLRAMAGSLAGLAEGATSVKVTQFDHPKAVPLEVWWRREEGNSAEPIHAWTELLPGLTDDPRRVLVTGSYYFVALVQERLRSLGGAPLPEQLGR